jgi:hypothetical protein
MLKLKTTNQVLFGSASCFASRHGPVSASRGHCAMVRRTVEIGLDTANRRIFSHQIPSAMKNDHVVNIYIAIENGHRNSGFTH